MSGWDWLAMGGYLLVTLAIGLIFSGRQDDASEYFLGGKRYSSLMVSLSLLATALSAITFLGVPGFVIQRDWTLLISSAVAVPAAIVVGRIFVPFFYRLEVTSAYEYLAMRFSARVALFNSSVFLLLRGLLAGVAIYAPSLALASVTGWNLTLCILVSGVVTIFYTSLGGMSAVIWTDVMQLLVLFGGGVLLLIMMAGDLGGTATANWQMLQDAGKLRLFDFQLGWDEMTFWNSLVGGFVFSVAFFGVDQVLVQRYMTSKSLPEARRSLYLNAAYTIPVLLLFFALGSVLWLFHQQNAGFFPEGLKADQYMTYYIVNKLPVGIPGIMVAAIYAAAMSTLSAVLNSLSAVTVTDFCKRWMDLKANPERELRLARGFTIFWGVVAIGAALGCHRLSDSVALAAIKAGSLFSGPLLATFLMGMAWSRCRERTAFWAGVAGLVLSLTAGFCTRLDVFWLMLLGTAGTLLVGLIIEAFSRKGPEPREERPVRRETAGEPEGR